MRLWTTSLLGMALLGCGGEGDASAVPEDTDTTTEDDTQTSATSTAPGDCSTWVMTYDLTGSRFFIDALVDFTITLQEPYDADENMGPGTLTLRMADVGGSPSSGTVALVDYALTQDFITGNAVAQVHTEIENTASDTCGVATGSLDGTLLTWSPATISNHCQNGQISCTGAFCGTAGSPPEDEPEILTDACSDQPITDFVFDAALESFEMETVVVSMDANATAAIQFTGTLLSAELDKATPSCLCP